mmetsp:Transcript_20717/g.50895  ORF Transcript_20717/g.50895 Transcript_20717/m.50895 type:complete len:325 (+) Transcript_20717:542-1516(+)
MNGFIRCLLRRLLLLWRSWFGIGPAGRLARRRYSCGGAAAAHQVGNWTRMHDFSLLPHDGLNVFQKLLLGSNHHSRPTNSHPGNDFWCRHSIMLHDICPNASPRSSQSSLAMDCKGFFLWNLFKGSHDSLQNVHGWTRSINVKLVQMLNPRPHEIRLLVHFLVESDNQPNIFFSKIGNVISWCQGTIAFGRYLFGKGWARKRHDFSLDNPIQISILHLFVIFIFFDIKVIEIKESKILGLFESMQTMHNIEIVIALDWTRIVKRRQTGHCHLSNRTQWPGGWQTSFLRNLWDWSQAAAGHVVITKSPKGLFWTPIQFQHLPRTD